MSTMREEGESGSAIGETTALRWEPTHVTKHNPRDIPVMRPPKKKEFPAHLET